MDVITSLQTVGGGVAASGMTGGGMVTRVREVTGGTGAALAPAMSKMTGGAAASETAPVVTMVSAPRWLCACALSSQGVSRTVCIMLFPGTPAGVVQNCRHDKLALQ